MSTKRQGGNPQYGVTCHGILQNPAGQGGNPQYGVTCHGILQNPAGQGGNPQYGVTCHGILQNPAGQGGNPQYGVTVLEAMGNFACARMAQAYYPEGDLLHLMGNMGVHDIDARLSTTEKGWILEGEFGDMHFRQTFTPVTNS